MENLIFKCVILQDLNPGPLKQGSGVRKTFSQIHSKRKAWDIQAIKSKSLLNRRRSPLNNTKLPKRSKKSKQYRARGRGGTAQTNKTTNIVLDVHNS
jgi:hypothetical protein